MEASWLSAVALGLFVSVLVGTVVTTALHAFIHRAPLSESAEEFQQPVGGHFRLLLRQIVAAGKRPTLHV
jgi:hypothetical protein